MHYRNRKIIQQYLQKRKAQRVYQRILVFSIVGLCLLLLLASCTNTRFNANCVITKDMEKDTEITIAKKVQECYNNPTLGIKGEF